MPEMAADADGGGHSLAAGAGARGRGPAAGAGPSRAGILTRHALKKPLKSLMRSGCDARAKNYSNQVGIWRGARRIGAGEMVGAEVRRVRRSSGRHRARRLVTVVVAVALAGLVAVPAGAAPAIRSTGAGVAARPGAAGQACPGVTSTPPIFQRVARRMRQMSL